VQSCAPFFRPQIFLFVPKNEIENSTHNFSAQESTTRNESSVLMCLLKLAHWGLKLAPRSVFLLLFGVNQKKCTCAAQKTDGRRIFARFLVVAIYKNGIKSRCRRKFYCSRPCAMLSHSVNFPRHGSLLHQ